MKKFTVALDGLKISESAIEYAVYLAKCCNAHLVGVFLDDFTYHSYNLSHLVKNEEDWGTKMRQLDQEDEETRRSSRDKFELACQQGSVEYTIHRDKNVAYQELLHETVYSDLLIISATETFTGLEANDLSGFVREILADTECPVVVVPPKYAVPDKIMILYDGDPSSVYAAKMFSYAMLGLHALPVEVITVKDEKQSLHLPDNRLMKEFMKRHFSNVRYTVLSGDPEQQIASYLRLEKEETLVVLGAYSRGRVSRWFRKSMADHVLSTVAFPVFVAHNT